MGVTFVCKRFKRLLHNEFSEKSWTLKVCRHMKGIKLIWWCHKTFLSFFWTSCYNYYHSYQPALIEKCDVLRITSYSLLSIYLSVYLSIYLSICRFIDLLDNSRNWKCFKDRIGWLKVSKVVSEVNFCFVLCLVLLLGEYFSQLK